MKKITCIALLCGSLNATSQVTFNPVLYNQIPEIFGNYYSIPLAVVDMNGDFLDDIVSVYTDQSFPQTIQILYQQTSGGFVTNTIQLTQATNQPDWSITVGDIDKNGYNDLLYGSSSAVSVLLANATGTSYSEIAFEDYVFSQRGNLTDINNDGKLDVFMCHDVGPNVYYINNGNGTFTFHQGGLGDHPEGGNYGSIWVDYDNDGDSDMFIAKCRGGGSDASNDELYRNNGDGTFTDVSVNANMHSSGQSWSSAWNDYDNDGDMDALIGASSSPMGDSSPHELMRNNGDGTFTNVTVGSGFDLNTHLSVEHVSYDFDNNGYADVLGGGNTIMFNNGNWTFTPGNIGTDFSHGVVGDLNNDGFLDIRSGTRVFYNNANANHWIKIQLKGIASNYNGIGARVELYSGGTTQIRDVQSGTGFSAMHTLNVHFGTGTHDQIDSVRVLWPSGHIDVVVHPEIDHSVTIIENTQPLSLLELDGTRITLYPNPATDFITISHIELLDVQRVDIYNYQGACVASYLSGFNQIPVATLSEGSYALVIRTKSGQQYSDSFVKRK